MDDALCRLHAKDDADYEFILEQLTRFCSLSPMDLIQYCRDHPEDNWYMLRLPNGNNVLLGNAANQRFLQIVERGLRHIGAKRRRFQSPSVLAALKDVFTERMQLIDLVLNKLIHTGPYTSNIAQI